MGFKMKKILLKLHLWISLPFGLIIALICFTGSIMVFEKEINELVYKERYKVTPVSGERITPAEAAAVAAAGVWQLPDALHLVVVDPGVGGGRRDLVLVTGQGTVLVGPDNGLFWPAIERWGGLEKSWRITNQEFLLHPVSATFHGRDIFAPVAAHLSRGVQAGNFGPEIDDLEKLLLPRPLLKEKKILGEVIGVDSFGESAPAGELFKYFGVTADAVVAAVRKVLA